jgi:hypothetical protein
MEKQRMPLTRIIKMQKEFAEIYNNTDLIGISSSYIQIKSEGMEEIASLELWTLNMPMLNERQSFQHEIAIQGVKFVAITSEPINILEKSI